jgi:hypothetical protein
MNMYQTLPAFPRRLTFVTGRPVETCPRRATVCAVTDVPGIRLDAVTDWLHDHVEGAEGPFRFDVIAA